MRALWHYYEEYVAIHIEQLTHIQTVSQQRGNAATMAGVALNYESHYAGNSNNYIQIPSRAIPMACNWGHT